MAPTCTACELHAESTFRIDGMDCREEVALIERRFRHLQGLEDFTADLLGRRIHVKYDAAKLSASAIAAAVADAGLSAWLEHEAPVGTPDAGAARRNLLLGLSGGALAAGLAAAYAGVPAASGLFLASLAAGVPLSIRRAWQSVRLRSLDIHVLMLIAASGALALGEWSEAAAVVFLFAVAQALEARTVDRARREVRALMELAPAEARVRGEDGDHRTVSIDAVTPGQIVLVRPGEKIPLDGEVVAGLSAVNQAPVTGESLPADKGPGDEVFAGSINGRGALDIRVTRLGRDTTLARIIHLVEQAQAQRAPSQTFVERFARVYTPAVIVLAGLLAVVPPLAFGAAWETWIYRALVLLVVSCPCALVISTPVSIVAALAGAARKGVLIKGGAHLERLASVRCIAFDKTGTLTHGRPEVVDVRSLNGANSGIIVALAAAVERQSDHPVAEAITRHAASFGDRFAEASGVVSLVGLGARGDVGGVRVTVGSHRLFEQERLCTPEAHGEAERLSRIGLTPVLVARDAEVIGIVGVADRPREQSRDAIDLLRRQAVAPIVMLSGDSRAAADAIGAAVGADEVRAELMPDDKVSAIGDLRSRHGAVAMVGDGVNDAPALAAADVGIAMGAVGSDAAIEAADIALMADEVMKVPYALRLARATVRNIKANLAISLALKAGFVVAAAAGAATLWMAILADTGASVIVVVNALRLLRAD